MTVFGGLEIEVIVKAFRMGAMSKNYLDSCAFVKCDAVEEN